jgi:hypothetical protein
MRSLTDLIKKYETFEEVKVRLRKKFPNITFGKNIITDEMREENRRIIDKVIERSNEKKNNDK